jgi:pimeloyl-[acyl-carrier protein] methyl ester esterase
MSRPRLTLLHGWGNSQRVFEPFLALLRPRYRVCAPALPGYPHSRWRAGQGFDAEIEQMAAELPAGPLLGWSLGGFYALELGLRYADKFGPLTLVAFNPCFVVRDDWPCAVEKNVFDEFARDLQQDWRRTIRRFLALQLQGGPAQRELARNLWRQIADAGEAQPGVLEAGLELLRGRDARQDLARAATRVRLVLGDRDRLVPVGVAQQIADLEPGIRVESVAGAAHAPFLSHPARVAALL